VDVEAITEIVNNIIEEKFSLDPWEKASNLSSKESAKKNFRRKVIKYYKREFNSSTLCMLTNELCEDYNSKAAHIWPASKSTSSSLDRLGMHHADIASPRNGLLILRTIEQAFDLKRCCFIYDPFKKKLLFHIVDPSLNNENIFSNIPFKDYEGEPLHHPKNRIPFLRMLSIHAKACFETQMRLGNINKKEFEEFKVFDEISNGKHYEELKEIPNWTEEGDEYIIGANVKAKYEKDKKWYAGRVIKVDHQSKRYCIQWKHYDGTQWCNDSDIEWLY